jgi:hypothetical protein
LSRDILKTEGIANCNFPEPGRTLVQIDKENLHKFAEMEIHRPFSGV